MSTPVALPEGAGLLYPSADARDLATLAEEQRGAIAERLRSGES